MPKLLPPNTPDILVKLAGYVGITHFPQPHLQQRGPSCGFSALAYTFAYWYETRTATSATPKPLPARTHMSIGGALAQTPADKETKRKDAASGKFTSLRQFAKYNALTVVGSVFSAENLLRVGTHAQPGIYDGVVDTAATVAEFETKILLWLGRGIPVIVPYDVNPLNGEPAQSGGNTAHWVTVLGCSSVAGVKQLLYFNWGEFYYAPLEQFAVSNRQLHSNKEVEFLKYEVYRDAASVAAGVPLIRDYMTAENVKMYQDTYKYHCVRVVGKEARSDRQHNDPAVASSSSSSTPVSSAASRNGGLRCKMVVLYPMGMPIAGASSSSSSPALPSSALPGLSSPAQSTAAIGTL